MTGMRGRRLRLLVLVVVALVATTGAGAVTMALGREPVHVTAVFSETVGLYPGSDVRVLGVKAGEVTSVTPRGEQVHVGLDLDAEVAVQADTEAVIVSPTMVSDRYVQFTRPWTSGPRLESGATIPQSRTATPVEIDEMYEALDEVSRLLGPEGANRDGALSELIRTGADNLEGNGAAMRKVITDLGQASRALSESGDDMFGAVDNLDRLGRLFRSNDDHVRRVNAQLARVTGSLARDRQVMTEAMRELGSALDDVERFVRENRGNIDSSARELSKTTRLLTQQQESLAQMLAVLPVTVQNALRSYDSDRRLLRGRGNPNDVTVWGAPDAGVAPHAPPKAGPPPVLLEPEDGEDRP